MLNCFARIASIAWITLITVSYKKVTTQVSQATSTSPMVVKAWVPLEPGVTAYVLGKAIGEATAEQPYGEFSFDYTINVAGPNLDVNQGSMSAAGTQLKWLEKGPQDHDGDDGTDQITMTSAAVINFGSGTTGSGAVRYIGMGDSTLVEFVAGYSFDANNFCRKNIT